MRSPLTRRDLLGQATLVAAASTLSPTVLRALNGLMPSADSRPYLDAALRAERWIARSAIKDGGRITWPANPGDPKSVQQNLYSGSAGVLLFYLELHRATGDARYLQVARGAADHLIATLPTYGAALGDEGAGLYTGVAGIAYALRLTFEATHTVAYSDAVDRIGRLLADAMRANRPSASWNESTDIISGTSGILLTLLWLEERDPSWREWREDERRVVAALIDAGVAEHGGLKWSINGAMPRRYPNFSHGTAGVGYTLATFAQHDREHAAPALDAARSGATYLDAITTHMPAGGRKIFHSEPGGEQLYYLSWCHGPAGTARFYRQLAMATRDARWNAYIPQLVQGITESGAPEQHPDRSGYWNNISQCCGNCGIAEFFTALYVAGRDPSHLALATRVMDNTLSRATTDGDGLKWVQAENRVSPLDVVAQTGLMQGAAGVGLALLHLDGALQRRKPFVVLPDMPSWG
ncbi:MAG: hypothetical protein IPP90_15995 [Gemmatimonadaceae bacterium]|nr:hypothetical protein [Gemmatimonadaceae bacterium]